MTDFIQVVNEEKLECLQEWHIQYHIRTIVLSILGSSLNVREPFINH